MVVGPDGQPVRRAADGRRRRPRTTTRRRRARITDLVEQPAKVMRIGSMIRQLLEEVKAAPLDEASRNRLKEIHQASIKELEDGPRPRAGRGARAADAAVHRGRARPSEAELRIAQAQLVGWLEGLFHGIQTAIYAQQMAARAQLEQMRRALPPGHGRRRPGRPEPQAAGRTQPHRPGRLRRACTSERPRGARSGAPAPAGGRRPGRAGRRAPGPRRGRPAG